MSSKLKLVPTTYYQSDSFELILGDCIEAMAGMMEDSIDMIFSDPPYNLSNGGFSIHSGKRVSVNKGTWDASSGVNDDFEFHLAWIEACRRILKPNGTIWISGTYHSIFQCGFALQKLNYHILNDITWFKPNGAPNLSCRFFTASHETLIWAKKDRTAKHTFNYEAMKNGLFPEDVVKKPGKQMRSLWSFNSPGPSEKTFGKHPTQKPIRLLERIVLASTNRGDLILDPFTGSSTTGVAAVQLGRSFIGIDLSSEYLDLSIERYSADNPHNTLQLEVAA